MRRLSDTKALAEPLREGTHTRHVEKVSNGHVVRQTYYGSDGPSYSKAEFVPAGERSTGRSSLREAMDHAKGRR